MNFDYDIFISYGSQGNSEDDQISSWASKFCEYLSILLKRIGNRELTFLLHDDLRARKQLLGTESPVVLTKTAIFVTLLSPEFTDTESYQKELQEVFNAVYQGTNEINRNVNRIFKVLLQPITSEHQPNCLLNEIGYDFFEINRFSKKSRTFQLDNENLPEEKFWFKLVDLAYDIHNSLNLISGSGNQGTKNVKYAFLAETSFDQTESRDEIKRELQHLGYNILPLVNLPNDGEQVEALVKKYLERSEVSIHLMGAYYGEFVKNTKHSLIDLQNLLVKSQIESSQPQLRRMIWIPSDIKITDQRQSLYLNRLKRDESTSGTEIIEAPIEVFKSVMKNRLAELEKPSPEISVKQKVYVIFENGNRDDLKILYSLLSENNIDIIEQNLSSQDAGIITNHKENLVNADAVLIYQGSSNKYWLYSKIQDLIKAPGFGKVNTFNTIGLISNENIDENIMKFLHNVHFHKSEVLDEAFCKNFLNYVKQENNGG